MKKRRSPDSGAGEKHAHLPGGLSALTGAAILLPFFLFSLSTDDSIREIKTMAQACAAGLALVTLARAGGGRTHGSAVLPRGLSYLLAAIAGLLTLSTLSGILGVADPYSLVPAGAALALAFIGWHRHGERLVHALIPLLVASAAFTGFLAVLQRYAGLFRLPFDAPQPRFFAAGLVGNPGDAAAGVVIPGLLALGAILTPAAPVSRRLRYSAGLAGCLAAIAATETVTALLAFGAGALFLLLRSRAGRVVVVGLAGVLILAIPLSGAGKRALEKAQQLRAGQWDAVFTQRDIGVLAAVEMIRQHPLLGSGPGTFENRFVPARFSAEARTGRRLVHRSGSSHFENAHSEPLTLAAECGIPAVLLLLVAFGWVVYRSSFSGTGRAEHEALPAATLSACLLAFGVLCLASFPLRIAVAAGPFALLLGLALGRSASIEYSEDPRRLPRWVPLAFGLGLLLFASVRWIAFSRFAEAEGIVRDIGSAPPAIRPVALEDARQLLESSARLAPRHSVTWLTLGVVHTLNGDSFRATDAFKKALRLEERAELVMNLARLAASRGELELAESAALRAVWTLPRLIDSAPSSVDREHLAREIARRESSGTPPPLPAF